MPYKSFDETPNKIRVTYEKIQNNENKLEVIKKAKVKKLAVNSFSNFLTFETEWVGGSSSSIVLTLEKFPEDFVPLIKIIPMIKTIPNSEIEDFYFYYTLDRIIPEEGGNTTYVLGVDSSVTTTWAGVKKMRIKVVILNERFYSEIRRNTK